MSESKHTPGPWMAASRPSSIVGWPVVAPGAMGRSVCNVTTGHDDAAANARLIAAAPDLLEALKLADELLEKHGFAGTDQNPKGVRDIMGSAIAKAEGLS